MAEQAQAAAPDPFDVLETTFGPDARPVRLDGDVTVVRTLGRHDAPDDAVLRRRGVAVGDLDAALADARERFAHPDATPRLVLPATDDLRAALATREDVRWEERWVLLRDDAPVGPARPDLRVGSPVDERGWHGVTVLHRHAGPSHEDRSRGAADDRLAWHVEGLATLVRLGRARVLRAERFGTPVGAGVLAWEPRVRVDEPHAGLAVVHDVVVHPAHRRLGVASALVDALVGAHLADFPRAQVATVVPTALRDAAVGRGWRAHASVLVVEPVAAARDA